MISIICAVAFIIVIIMSLLIIFGLPLGEFTMGGKYKVFPKNMRIFLLSQLLLQVWYLTTILQIGNHLPLWFPAGVTRVIGIVMAITLSLNVVMNFFSKSKKERYCMTPLSALTAVCFWISVIQM